MRRSFFLTTIMAVLTLAAQPSSAAEMICVLPDAPSISPTQAAEILQSALPGGRTLSTASEAELGDAFKAAVFSHEGSGAGVAALIAAGRPDLMPMLGETVRSVCPSSAEMILSGMGSSAASPSADEWAALALLEGAAPAAGPATPSDADGSPQ